MSTRNIETTNIVKSSTYKSFSLLPHIDFYWCNEDHLEDRLINIGWLFWDFDIQF